MRLAEVLGDTYGERSLRCLSVAPQPQPHTVLLLHWKGRSEKYEDLFNRLLCYCIYEHHYPFVFVLAYSFHSHFQV